jgi:hypothetical protein
LNEFDKHFLSETRVKQRRLRRGLAKAEFAAGFDRNLLGRTRPARADGKVAGGADLSTLVIFRQEVCRYRIVCSRQNRLRVIVTCAECPKAAIEVAQELKEARMVVRVT